MTSTTTTKTMTCEQLGGPCDLRLTGESADDIIKQQDRHLRDAVKGGDTAHEPAHEAMKGRWRHPIKGMGLVQGHEEGVRRPSR